MVRLIFYALFVMFSVQLTTSAVTHLTVTASSSCFAFAVETLRLAVMVSPRVLPLLPRLNVLSSPLLHLVRVETISPPAALLNLFSQPEQANTKRGYASLPCRILCTSSRSPTQTHTLCLMFAVSVPSQGPIPRSPSHHNSYITVSLASFAVSPTSLLVVVFTVLECGFAKFTQFYVNVASPSHYTVFTESTTRPSHRSCYRISARRLDRTEALCLLLIQNECDDIKLRSIPVTNYWLRDDNVEGLGFDPIKPFSLSSNSIVLSVLMKAKLTFEIHTVSLRSFVEFKTDRVNFSANSSQIGLLLLGFAPSP
ncbi:hypothetical protein F2Q70_00020154 [Brassica cretica]|uniref:Uncharacterized protein n=1 Tax=Brassica cretica TaxID=69181 RepID=A0A8S9GWD6_BRACR|nr:hypothetical protein F2Q70_00020154 [Brassica cretica]